jgi:Flp pilus assembly protein TadG
MAALNRWQLIRWNALGPRGGQKGSLDRGAELVEFALVLPVLLLILVAIMDFAFMFKNYEVITNAAREGARVGVLSGYSTADAVARAEAYLSASGLTDAHPAPVAALTTVPVTVNGTPTTMNAIQVTVSYPHGFLLLGPISRWFGGAGLGAITIRGTATMRTEAQAGS